MWIRTYVLEMLENVQDARGKEFMSVLVDLRAETVAPWGRRTVEGLKCCSCGVKSQGFKHLKKKFDLGIC